MNKLSQKHKIDLSSINVYFSLSFTLKLAKVGWYPSYSRGKVVIMMVCITIHTYVCVRVCVCMCVCNAWYGPPKV